MHCDPALHPTEQGSLFFDGDQVRTNSFQKNRTPVPQLFLLQKQSDCASTRPLTALIKVPVLRKCGTFRCGWLFL